MTALAAAPTLFDELAGEPTLDEALIEAWTGLVAGRVAECLVCGGRMEPAPRSGERAARCTACGTTLA